VGQGAIAIEHRADDARTRDMLAPIGHADTATALAAERAFLAELDGSCRTPIAGHARISAGALHFRGMILKPDGSEAFETTRTGDIGEAEKLGADAGGELRARAGADYFAGV
jgi:hydroxymethylbilane synthase